MNNPIKEIWKFQSDAGLIEKGYDDFLESSFQIEEALEGFKNVELIYHALDNYNELSTSIEKDTSRTIVQIAKEGCLNSDSSFNIPDVDRLDKACDAVVFAIGSMAKLGLNPQQIQRALLVVNNANMQKLKNKSVDEQGKLNKPKDFVNPEPLLQKILDERKN